MGIAEVIPGVSGGTIAFITGIYETLLNSIKAFSPSLLTTLKKDGIAGVWRKINGNFLVALVLGMGIGAVSMLKIVTNLLHTRPVLLWAFFFGLIIASVVYIGRQITKWGPLEAILLVIGAILTYWVTTISPVEASGSYVMIFFGGMIAICAFILPGISGSFMLLLMGLYTVVIPAVKSLTEMNFEQLPMVIVFAAGCLIGLLSFSHVVSWTFKNFRNQTLALLTGVMLGSLGKIWPWRIPVRGVDESYKVTTDPNLMEKVIEETKVLPAKFHEYGQSLNPTQGSETVLCIAFMVVGIVAVVIMSTLGNKSNHEG